MQTLIKNVKELSGNTIDILIEAGKIKAMGSNLSADETATVLDVKGESYVSAGWVDAHVHAYAKEGLVFSDQPDDIGIKLGVTTLIDAGTAGADDIKAFSELAQRAKTNVYAMMNASRVGLSEPHELSKMENVDEVLFEKVAREYPAFVVGVKARMSRTVVGENELEPLKSALRMKQATGLPLMVHVGSVPPQLDEILEIMGEGDIMTHCFNGKANGIVDQATQTIKGFVHDAYKKGMIFDIGHGSESFSFNTAKVALTEGIKAHCISTDIYKRNREGGPVYDFATTMEKMLLVGYALEEVIDKVTRVPAQMFNLSQKGRLEVGADGDLTLFKQVTGTKEFVDSEGQKETGTQQIIPTHAIVGGEIYVC